MSILNPGSAGTAVVNGQLTSQAPGVSFTPLGYVPYAAQGAARPPSLPPSVYGYGSSQASGYVGSGEPSTYASANDNASMVSNAMANPFHPGSSPAVVIIVFLAISLFFLHFVHFRTVAEGGEGKLGGEAEAGVKA
jgi:hypothetical protein